MCVLGLVARVEVAALETDAFEHTLQDVYFAENAIAKALPNVIEAVSNTDLKTILGIGVGFVRLRPSSECASARVSDPTTQRSAPI